MPAKAEVQQKIGTFAGLQVTYRVILPHDYDATRAYPTVLHFAGGPQTLQIVERSTRDGLARECRAARLYRRESRQPRMAGSIFEEGARIFPAFIDQILKSYKVAGGKLHATGHSNGGLSAYHIASLYPAVLHLRDGLSGASWTSRRRTRLAALKPLCLYMHVGEQDTQLAAVHAGGSTTCSRSAAPTSSSPSRRVRATVWMSRRTISLNRARWPEHRAGDERRLHSTRSLRRRGQSPPCCQSATSSAAS